MHETTTSLSALVRCTAAAVFLLSAPASWSRDVTDPYWEYRDEVGRGEFSYDDSQDIPWIENETEVLALPREDDLTRVNMDQLPEGFALFVDLSRITVNPKDRVIRLWLWTQSATGSASGSFEGYRCDTKEYKVYAYANPRRDPPVTKARKPRWKFAHETRYGNYRAELLGDYFCGIRGTRDEDDIRRRLGGQFEREYFISQ